jgi:hypothetical protein
MDNYSGVVIDACTGYFLDNPAPSGLVTLGGTATTTALANVFVNRGGFVGLAKLHNSYPVTSKALTLAYVKTFVIQYNSVYPAGNNNYNWGLALNIGEEVSKFSGPSWSFARVCFSGSDGLTSSPLLVDVVKDELGSITIVAITSPPAFTITNNSTTTATLTFVNDGFGRWFNMTARYQITS